MRLDPSQWRSSAAYAYLDALIASDLAWECLRRNADYQADFEATAAQNAPDAALSARWGLRFPDGSGAGRIRGARVLDDAGRSRDGGARPLALDRSVRRRTRPHPPPP